MKITLALDARSFDLNLLKKLKINLRESTIDHKWVPQDSLHVNFISLGDLSAHELPALIEKIRNIAQSIAPFDLDLNGVWAYPEQKEARLLWVSVQNSRELNHLRSEFLKFIEGSELFNEEDYRPILPVVRFKNYRSVTDIISPFKNTRFNPLFVNKILVVEMSSGGAYPTYKVLSEILLQKQQLSLT